MSIFPHILHTFPAEWWSLLSAFAAVIIAAIAFHDAHVTREEVADLTEGHELDLLQLATVELESVGWNFIGQFALLIVAVVSVLTPPPPWPTFEAHVPHIGIAETMAHGWIIRVSLTLVSIFSVVRDLRMMRVRSNIVRARRQRLIATSEAEHTTVAEMSKTITTLSDTLKETTAVEHETLATVKEAQQTTVETKDIAEEIKVQITETKRKLEASSGSDNG